VRIPGALHCHFVMLLRLVAAGEGNVGHPSREGRGPIHRTPAAEQVGCVRRGQTAMDEREVDGRRGCAQNER
jgi:hypothetical protein